MDDIDQILEELQSDASFVEANATPTHYDADDVQQQQTPEHGDTQAMAATGNLSWLPFDLSDFNCFVCADFCLSVLIV